MKLENARRIVKAAHHLGFEEVKLRVEYVGRGMRTSTSGVIGSRSRIIQAIAAAGAYLGQHKPDDVDQFVDDMDLAFDNMGMDIIAY